MNVQQYFRVVKGPAGFATLLPNQVSGLEVWYDVNDFSTITQISGVVSQINDKSGNSRHATQATDAARPAYETNVQNGKPALKFDGINDFLRSDFTLSGFPLVIFGVYKGDNGTYTTSYNFNNSTYFTEGLRKAAIGTAMTVPSEYRTSSGSVLVGTTGFASEDRAAVAFASLSATSIRVMDQFTDISEAHSLAYGAMNKLFLGKLRDSGLFSSSHLFEVFMYSAIPTEDEIVKLFNYLKIKYAIGTPV